ncbi:putative ammonia monooxygenase [compost metagenome]
MNFPELRQFFITLLIGTAGALIAIAIGFPAPYLIGPALAVTFAGLAGLRLGVPLLVRNACFVIIGISMGSTVTPEIFVAARTWPLSFVMVFVAIVILLFSAAWVLQRLFRYDRTTALLAASPGHLGYVLSLAAEMRCDLRAVSISQSVRVLALTISVPLIVEFFDLADTDVIVLPDVMSMPILVVMLIVSAGFGLLFQRWKFPAALLLGGVFVSISTHITGSVSGTVPDWLLIPIYVLLGSLIGSRFSGLSFADLRLAIVSGLVVTVVVMALAGGIAVIVSYFANVPLDAALIAFSPGGLETMAAMAVMLHADPTYVGAHHVLRLMFLSVLMPLVIGRDARLK